MRLPRSLAVSDRARKFLAPVAFGSPVLAAIALAGPPSGFAGLLWVGCAALCGWTTGALLTVAFRIYRP